MKKTNNTARMRDFYLTIATKQTQDDDITEWFSDNDVYLSDIIDNENIGAFPRIRLSNH